MAAAYYLSRRHEVTLFEREARLGGHTRTVTANSSAGPVSIDIGFIVHNRVTYPNFCKLLDELGVETQPSDMSFGVSDPQSGFEYSSRGLRGFFAQSQNLFRPEHYGLLREIVRFNREAPGLREELGLGEFLRAGDYSREFISRYLYPMASAIWSMPQNEIEHFPAMTLVRFFENHGLFAIRNHPCWYTVRGGSQSYIPKLTAPYAGRIRLSARIESIARTPAGVWIAFQGGERERFDELVVACHGDQVLPLLADATPAERAVFGQFRTTRNEVCLHTDESMLPRRAAARASWNYLLHDGETVTLTYDMNRLQSLYTEEQFCVTLNRTGHIRSSDIVLQTEFRHPVFDRATTAAQERWGEVSGRQNTHYCGAYWFYGFHEDGVRSALRVARALGCAV